jgi:hypothetical protein
MGILEENIERSIFHGSHERTSIDKMMARDDVMIIKDLIKKPELTRSELLELLYMILSTESKMLNYGEYDRYVILKFFIWIRELIKGAEFLFDYRDKVKKYQEVPTNDENLKEVRRNTMVLLDNNVRLIEHNAKFLIDLYLNIGRTSLSIGATGFLEPIKNKYEIAYPQQHTAQPEAEKKGLLRWR